MLMRMHGINTVHKQLANGTRATYYYHRATGKRLAGKPGSPEFVASIAAAEARMATRDEKTLAGLIRAYKRWAQRRGAESTFQEYARLCAIVEEKYGSVPYAALEDPAFRRDVLEWHDEMAESIPREADNRVSTLSRVLNWGVSRTHIKINVLAKFEHAYIGGDRADLIWLPEHIERFMAVAEPELNLALMMALHTGQRQNDLLQLPWSAYANEWIRLRQSKSRKRSSSKGRTPATGRLVEIPCTQALRETLDEARRRSEEPPRRPSRDRSVAIERGVLMLTTPTGARWKKRYFARCWAEATAQAGITDLHFHDLRGTAVTMLAEAGCTVPEIASITGHKMRSVETILETYLSRTRALAASAIAKLEVRLAAQKATNPANQATN